MSAPTPVTKQHLKLIDEIRVGDRCMRFDITDAQAAQLIADSEAKSCGELSCDECNARTAGLTAERDQLRAEVEKLWRERDEIETFKTITSLRAEVERWELAFQEQYARAERAEAELATERARLDWLESRGPWESWVQSAKEISMLLRAPIREGIDAAIDAAMKEGA